MGAAPINVQGQSAFLGLLPSVHYPLVFVFNNWIILRVTLSRRCTQITSNWYLPLVAYLPARNFFNEGKKT